MMVRYRITPNDRMCQLVCILTWDRQTRRLRMHEMRAGGEAGKRMCESGVKQMKVGALAGCKSTMCNTRAGATTGGKRWLEARRAGQRCSWMVGYHPPGRSHTSHTLGVALCLEQKQRRNVPCSDVSEDTFPKRTSACCLLAHHPQHRPTTCPSSKPTTPERHARVRLEEQRQNSRNTTTRVSLLGAHPKS
jgi:hypothetical protein